MILCASRVGQILNKDSLAGDVGISSKTIDHWLSILEACYIVYRLRPILRVLEKELSNRRKSTFAMLVWWLTY